MPTRLLSQRLVKRVLYSMWGMEHMQFWHWWVLAVILLILEVFSPAAFFMWMSVAAGVIGLVLLAVPDLSWQAQCLGFAALSVPAILAGRSWFKRNPIASEQPSLNKMGEELVGKVFNVAEAIINGQGRIKVGETTWKVSGEDLPVGAKVKVTSVQSAVLQVVKTD